MEQKSTQSKVLLIHNHFRFSEPVTWLSLIIRIVTCSKWNHAAILKDGEVWESVGRGIIRTDYEVWLKKSARIVAVLNPTVPINIVLESGAYGYLDLIQIFLHIIRTRWFSFGNSWNGVSGTRIWKGVFCSEFVGLALGVEKSHLLTPADILHLPGLEFEKEFETP